VCRDVAGMVSAQILNSTTRHESSGTRQKMAPS